MRTETKARDFVVGIARTIPAEKLPEVIAFFIGLDVAEDRRELPRAAKAGFSDGFCRHEGCKNAAVRKFGMFCAEHQSERAPSTRKRRAKKR